MTLSTQARQLVRARAGPSGAPPVPESELAARAQAVAAFEAAHGVALPEDFRPFASEVDLDGGWCQPASADDMPPGFLARPFPHTAAWNDDSKAMLVGRYNSPHYDDALWTGAMRILNAGCELYFILVVTGAEPGHVWYGGRHAGAGIVPVENPRGRRVRFADLTTPSPWSLRDWFRDLTRPR